MRNSGTYFPMKRPIRMSCKTTIPVIRKTFPFVIVFRMTGIIAYF